MAFRATYVILYSLLFVFCTILLGLTAYRIHYTESLSNGDILTTSSHFYDPKIVALLVATVLTIIFSLVMLGTVGMIGGSSRGLAGHHFGLWILWIFFLITAALVTEEWSNLKWCRGSHKVCRILETIKAFSWICWGFLTFLLIATLIQLFRRRGGGTTLGTRDAAPATATATAYPHTREAPATTTPAHATTPQGGQGVKREAYVNQSQPAATAEPLYERGVITTGEPRTTGDPRTIV